MEGLQKESGELKPRCPIQTNGSGLLVTGKLSHRGAEAHPGVLGAWGPSALGSKVPGAPGVLRCPAAQAPELSGLSSWPQRSRHTQQPRGDLKSGRMPAQTLARRGNLDLGGIRLTHLGKTREAALGKARGQGALH